MPKRKAVKPKKKVDQTIWLPISVFSFLISLALIPVTFIPDYGVVKQILSGAVLVGLAVTLLSSAVLMFFSRGRYLLIPIVLIIGCLVISQLAIILFMFSVHPLEVVW